MTVRKRLPTNARVRGHLFSRRQTGDEPSLNNGTTIPCMTTASEKADPLFLDLSCPFIDLRTLWAVRCGLAVVVTLGMVAMFARIPPSEEQRTSPVRYETQVVARQSGGPQDRSPSITEPRKQVNSSKASVRDEEHSVLQLQDNGQASVETTLTKAVESTATVTTSADTPANDNMHQEDSPLTPFVSMSDAVTAPAETEGTVGTIDLRGGTIGPQYVFDSFDEYVRLARDSGGLFLAHDPRTRLTIIIGRSLDPRDSNLEIAVDHKLAEYASRMSALSPQHAQVERLRTHIRATVKQLGPATQIVLALPSELDAAILFAQRTACQQADVRLSGRIITGGHFVREGSPVEVAFRVVWMRVPDGSIVRFDDPTGGQN